LKILPKAGSTKMRTCKFLTRKEKKENKYEDRDKIEKSEI
jgi:hypothetical protein